MGEQIQTIEAMQLLPIRLEPPEEMENVFTKNNDMEELPDHKCLLIGCESFLKVLSAFSNLKNYNTNYMSILLTC